MFKHKDWIFWVATGIFLLSLVLFWVFQNQFVCFLMLLSYLLRPTLATIGLTKHSIDERQISIHYRSGNIAFVAVIVTCIVMVLYLANQDNHDWELFVIVILIGIVSKALFNVLLIKNYRSAASKIIITAGLFIALFEFAEILNQPFSFQSLLPLLPGLLIAFIGKLSTYFPRTFGILVIALSIAASLVILGKGLTMGQLATELIVAVPLALSGICLFIGDKETSLNN